MTAKAFLAEAEAELAKFTELLAISNSHLAKYPHDTEEQEQARKYESVIARASRVIAESEAN